MIHLLLAGGFILFIPLWSQGQSGWAKGQDELFAKLSYSYFQSDNYHTLSGKKLSANKFRQQALSFYGEYGITDQFTAIVDWPLLKFQGFETTETISGVGDLKLGVKYQLPVKIPISISIIPELPIAAANKYAENQAIPGDRSNLPTGDGELNIYTILAISHSFYPAPVYVSVYGIYNYRTKYEQTQLSDQLIEGLEVGGGVIKNLWLKTGFKLQQTLSNDNATVSFVRGEGTEYSSWFGGAFYQLPKGWGLDVNAYGYLGQPQKLRNIYQGPTFSLGVVYEVK